MDKYEEEDDEMDIEKKEDKINPKNSHIYFRPFSEIKNLKEWHFELQDGESVDCLAIGTGWVCAFTDFGYFRVFSCDGIQKYIMCQGTPVVSMTGYEN